MEWRIFPAEAVANVRNIGMMEYINWMESGHENVYAVDDDGKFCWRAATKKSRIQKNEHGGWSISLDRIPPIVYDGPMESQAINRLAKEAEKFVAEGHVLSEFPIVNSGGQSSQL